MLCFERHQHRSRQKGFTAFGQVLLVAAACGGDQPRQFQFLAELIEKTVNDGDHIHIPGLDLAPFGCVLE